MTELTANEKLTALADEIRELSITADKKSLTEMITHLESVNDELEDQVTLIKELAAIIDTLPEAGVGPPTGEFYNHIINGTLPEIVDNNILKVGSYIFGGQSLLTKAEFSRATSIGSCAFVECSALQEIKAPQVTWVGGSAFQRCVKLQSLNFPNLVSIGGAYAFAYCSSLTTISLPKLTATNGAYTFAYNSKVSTAYLPLAKITTGDFQGCYNLTSIYCPNTSTTGNQTFQYCSKLTSLELPRCTSIGTKVFEGCCTLLSLYLMNSSVCKLAGSNAFKSTPIAGYTTYTSGILGNIYVPASLLSKYQSATNWTYFSSRFVGV